MATRVLERTRKGVERDLDFSLGNTVLYSLVATCIGHCPKFSNQSLEYSDQGLKEKKKIRETIENDAKKPDFSIQRAYTVPWKVA